MTYSIVARDPSTGQMGVAVQSHWFSVGSVVTWGEAGVGVVATQAFANPTYGPKGLDLMRGGTSSRDALEQLTAADEQADMRQVAMIDVNGVVAVHTGARCLAGAGHAVGEHFSAQANMMLTETVPQAMADAFESSSGNLTDRLLEALDAAEAEGGDIRGRQSSALLVVRGARADNAVEGRVTELRVEDHAEPLDELHRLVRVQRAYEHMNKGDEHVAKGEMDDAAREYETAQRDAPGNVEFTFWRGVMLANFDRIDEAKEFLETSYGAEGDWKELLRRLPRAAILSEEKVRQLVD